MKHSLRAIALAAATTAFSPAFAAPPAASCDRACQIDAMNGLLGALVAHDPKRAPLAAHVRYTENGQELALGDGFWGTASAIGTYRHYFTDPVSGNVGFFGVMKENGDPVILTARIRIAGRKISEIETIVSRETTPMAKAGIEKLEKMQRPEAIWNEDVPISERASRAELIRTANKYFSGLERNKPNGDYSFFADDCDRLENGMETTNAKAAPSAPANAGVNVMTLGCRAQFGTGFFQMVTRIRDRRFLAIDEQKGVVFSMVFFDHAGKLRQETLADGRTIPVDLKAPFTWEMGEAFKITHGQIRRVEAVMTQSPYGMKPGWSGGKIESPAPAH